MPQSPKQTVYVPKRSWRPLKKHNRLTGKCGTLVPVFCTEVIPGTKAFIRQTLGVTLPPLVSDTYMSVSYKTEAFFIATRILFGGAEDWFCQDAAPSISAPNNAGDSGTVVSNIPNMPRWQLDLTAGDDAVLAPGTLADYLGVRGTGAVFAAGSSAFVLNPLPFLAYHMCYEWYYRAPLIQQHVFAMPSGKGPLINSGCDYLAAMMPYVHDGYTIVGDSINGSGLESDCFADGHYLGWLRQRNFGFDYFTLGYPSNPGDNISVSVAGGAFSINSLRAANSLTLFSERNQIAGKRLCDVVAARYGADLSMGVSQMPILLGSASYEVYNRSVALTAGNSDPNGLSFDEANPYGNSAGGKVGSAFAGGSDNIVDGFEVNEHGYIMIIGSLVPRACYGSGVRAYLRRYINGLSSSITELANPLLQNVGYDTIKAEELDSESAFAQTGSIFSYTEKFSSFFNFEDECHGLFREGSNGGVQNLSAFVLQRNFNDYQNPPQISSAFLEIPTDFMDNVTIVKTALSKYGYELDYYVEGGFLVPLYKHSMPSLQDPAYEHGKPVTVHRGGFRF